MSHHGEENLSGVNSLSLREDARIRLAESYSRAAEELTLVADLNCRVENGDSFSRYN